MDIVGLDTQADGGTPLDDFTGTITTGDQDAALLCLDRAEAAPLRGTLQGDVLTVAGPTPLAAQSIPCSLPLEKRSGTDA